MPVLSHVPEFATKKELSKLDCCTKWAMDPPVPRGSVSTIIVTSQPIMKRTTPVLRTLSLEIPYDGAGKRTSLHLAMTHFQLGIARREGPKPEPKVLELPNREN